MSRTTFGGKCAASENSVRGSSDEEAVVEDLAGSLLFKSLLLKVQVFESLSSLVESLMML